MQKLEKLIAHEYVLTVLWLSFPVLNLGCCSKNVNRATRPGDSHADCSIKPDLPVLSNQTYLFH